MTNCKLAIIIQLISDINANISSLKLRKMTKYNRLTDSYLYNI